MATGIEVPGVATPVEAAPSASPDEILHVPLDQIDPCVHQSREVFDEAEEIALAANLTTFGQIQPGLAWYDAGRGRYGLICGERRWRALRRAKMPTMALQVIRGRPTPGQMLSLNLAENLQRATINFIERGKAFKRLMQLEDLNASEVAKRMNVSNATVSNALALLELPEPLQVKVASGELPPTVAVHLARVGDDATRRDLADQYAAGSLNRSGVAAEVGRLLKPGKKPAKPSRLACRVDGVGISLTAKTLQWDSLLSAIARLHSEAERLQAENKPVTDLARVLRAS